MLGMKSRVMCSRHVGTYPSTMGLDDDDYLFAGQDLPDLDALVQKMFKEGIDIAPSMLPTTMTQTPITV